MRVRTFLDAIMEFREAFIVAVGDKSPFAKEALKRIDLAIEIISQENIKNL